MASAMSTFSKFPAELVLHVFQYLPIPSLHAMSQLSKDWYGFYTTHQSVIFHQAALLHQFIPHLDIPLCEAKKAYFGSYIKDENDWRGFCHQIFQLNRNWAGKGSSVFRMSQASGSCVHRIKVDEKARLLITTHMIGGIKVVDLETDTLLWHLPESYVRSWAHCEYQNGFLIFDRFGEFKEVWRLTTDYHLNPPPVVHRPDVLQLGVSESMARRYHGCPERGQFKPWALVQTSEWGRAFRFVYPSLLVAATGRAYIYDVVSADLVQTIKDTQMVVEGTFLGDINYVEMNESLVFVCGTCELRGFHRANGALALRIPHTLPPEIPRLGVEVAPVNADDRLNVLPLTFSPREIGDMQLDTTFVGVHVHGNDLVALLSSDSMLLVRDFPSLIKGEKRLSDVALEISFSEPQAHPFALDFGRRSIYVAFEHEHVGVITTSGLFVFAIDGTSHCVVDVDTEFTSDSLKGTAFPHLIGTSVAYITETRDLYQVVSCLQMTETGIYVTLDHRNIPVFSQKGKKRQPLGQLTYNSGIVPDGEDDLMDEEGPDEAVVPVGDMDEAGSTSATTADREDIRNYLLALLQPQPYQAEGMQYDGDDDPITIHTTHVNTEDEEHFYEDDDDDEIFTEAAEDLEEAEYHSVVWLDYTPR